MDFSVIICTRNRANQLRNVLRSASDLIIPDSINWELLVVDNGSIDDTQQVVSSFSQRLPIRSVLQPKPGLSNARNQGIKHARGKYIIWTDDDVILDRNWLCAYSSAFRRWPDAAIFGGRVRPLIMEPSPSWFLEAVPYLGLLLAVRDFGDIAVPLSLSEDRLPFGLNFAVRTEEQKNYLFDPALGVAPGRRRGGEETAMISEILRAGHRGWWVPAAIVNHVIPTNRQTKEYVFEYYQAMGEASAFYQIRNGANPVLGAPARTWIKVFLALIRYRIAKTMRQLHWIRYFSSYAYHRGALTYWLTPSKQRR